MLKTIDIICERLQQKDMRSSFILSVIWLASFCLGHFALGRLDFPFKKELLIGSTMVLVNIGLSFCLLHYNEDFILEVISFNALFLLLEAKNGKR